MNEFYAENFLQACSKGNVEECKKLLQQGVDVNHTDKEGASGLFNAVMNNQLDVCRFLVSNNVSLETQNKENQTPLHLACDKGSKEIVLFLVTNGFDTTVKNGAGQKPGEGTMEMKIFINNLSSENKAFDALKSNHKTKLQQIFDDIDTDNAKCIDLQKAIVFNKFVEDNLNDQAAEKDARDFIKTAGLCNQTTVNIDEWYFSFAKLYAVDPQTYDKFIEEYDKAVEKKGKIRFQGN